MVYGSVKSAMDDRVKWTVERLYIRGPRNRLLLWNTVYFKRFFMFYMSVTDTVDLMVWCNGAVQIVHVVTVTARFDRAFAP